MSDTPLIFLEELAEEAAYCELVSADISPEQ